MSWIGRLNTVQMSMLLKVIYRFNGIHIKIQRAFFFTEIDIKTMNSQINSRKNKTGGTTLSDLKLYYSITNSNQNSMILT